MGRPKLNVMQKVQKEMPEFTAETAGLSVDQLNARLAQLAKDGEGVEEAKESDEALEDAKDTVSACSGPYRDAKKAIRLKQRYIIGLIKEKGGDA